MDVVPIVKIRIENEEAGSGWHAEEPTYYPFLVERKVRGASLCASTVLHVLVVLLVVCWRFIGPLERFPYTPKSYEVKFIRYSLPDRLLFAAAGRAGGGGETKGGGGGGRGRSGGSGPGRRAARPAAPRKVALLPAPIVAAAPPKPVFQVPTRAKPVVRNRDLVIQPDFSLDLQITGKVELPNLMLWSQREIQPLVRQLKTFVPGEPKRKPPSPRALPDAPPKLELPNRETRVVALKMGSIPAPALPAFSMPVGTTSPVQIRRRELEAPSELPATALPPGQPVNLLSMIEQPALPAGSYTVAGGNRVPPIDGPTGAAGGNRGAGTDPSAAGSEGTGAGSGNARAAGGGAAGAGGTGSGAGAGKGAGTGTGGGTGGGVGGAASGTGAGAAGSAGAGGGRGSGSGAGTGIGKGTGAGTGSGTGGAGTGAQPGGAGVRVAGLRLEADAVGIRTESPNASSFDIVVVNQGVREVLPEAAGILTGQPVYTTYLAAPGPGSEWIMQYAVPHSHEPVKQLTDSAVRVGAATRVRAPFPLRKAPLLLGRLPRVEGRVVVFGYITEKGVVGDLRVIRGSRSEIDSAVLACLRQFLFRPAVRDGVPVLVEVLFGIPLN